MVVICPHFLSLVPGRDTDNLLLTAACLPIRLPASNQQKIPELAFPIYKTNIRTYNSPIQFIFSLYVAATTLHQGSIRSVCKT